jgi:hypothetical protein
MTPQRERRAVGDLSSQGGLQPFAFCRQLPPQTFSLRPQCPLRTWL